MQVIAGYLQALVGVKYTNNPHMCEIQGTPVARIHLTLKLVTCVTLLLM